MVSFVSQLCICRQRSYSSKHPHSSFIGFICTPPALCSFSTPVVLFPQAHSGLFYSIWLRCLSRRRIVSYISSHRNEKGVSSVYTELCGNFLFHWELLSFKRHPTILPPTELTQSQIGDEGLRLMTRE